MNQAIHSNGLKAISYSQSFQINREVEVDTKSNPSLARGNSAEQRMRDFLKSRDFGGIWRSVYRDDNIRVDAK